MRQIEGKEGGRQAEVKMVRGRILEQSLWVASIVSTVLPAQALKQRHEVAEADTWDLRPLFVTSADWEKNLERLRSYEGVMMKWKGHLAKGEDLLGSLEKEKEIDLLAERLGQYASLKVAEDGADGSARDRALRLEFLLTRLSEEMAWFLPELMRIEDDAWGKLLEQPCLVEWKGSLERIRRQRPHILPEGEERLLTLAGPALGGADEIFSQLTNVDFRFGLVQDEDGREVELTHGTFASLLQRRSTEVRRLAWQKYYEEFERHAFSLSATLATSVRTDVFRARARKHPSARDHALFPDRVPGSVVDNLIAVVRKNLGPLQRYHRLRKKILGLEQLRAADLQVPIVAVAEKKTSFAEAAALVTQATAPLGEEYSATLARGLGEGRWVDRYENRGKRSGAFSSGSYGSPPYILMNYREDVLADVYTLAHEAGHSMHSWMSQRAQLFQDAHYPIFLAEVASTFNEELLTHAYLEGPAKKDRTLRATILNRQIDDIRGTLYRQVMFAEFEQKIHAAEEKGVGLTLDFFRIAYRELLESYLGEVLEIEPPLELECLRIPHFYSAFYVYKYAIGLSAAMTLSQRVLQGEVGAVGKVHEFLSSGGSRPPLETLRRAGVDMESPEPIESALSLFAARVEELEAMLGVAS